MTTTIEAGVELETIVRAQVAAALGLEPDEVTSDATLVGDLGAESLDMLDMLFRIEKKVGVKVTMKDVSHILEGNLSKEEFVDEYGHITRLGLVQLQKALPQLDPVELEGKLDASGVFSLFTVQNLTDMVRQVGEGLVVQAA